MCMLYLCITWLSRSVYKLAAVDLVVLLESDSLLCYYQITASLMFVVFHVFKTVRK